MFRVTTSITGGHEPGEVKPAEAFKGCDLDFLVGNGALVPVDGPATLTAAPTDPAHLMDEVERLTGELGACRDELAVVRSQLALTAEERDADVADVERLRAECGRLAEARDALQAELTAVRDVIADDPQPKRKK